MPTRAQLDDYDSEDFEDTETLISRSKSARPKSAMGFTTKKSIKKGKKRPGTPGRGRAQSAYSHHIGKDLWMNAIKKRQTLMHNGGGRNGESPRHKTPIEYWMETLRKTRAGISTESTGMNTFSGLKKGNEKFYPYLSTSHYTRNVMGTEKPSRYDDPTVRPSPGRPAYKTPEEYYDEVLELRKQIAAFSQESATMKTKVRRLEEDNLKKEKEIESLLDPGKSEEIRRALGDRKPDSSAVIHSLKQKILKREVQLRDRESAYNKLQADLKVTKIDELKVQMEAMYGEIVRLQNVKSTSSPGKSDTVKVKALNETILRLHRTNDQLQQETKTLKEDLQKALDDADTKSDLNRDYSDMNRKELLLTIAKLEKRANRAERGLETDSLLSGTSGRDGDTFSSKIRLTGSTEQRLTQLDQRETELLDEIQKLKATIKRLIEERRKRGHDRDETLPPTPTPRRVSRQDSSSVFGRQDSVKDSVSVVGKQDSVSGSRRPSSARRDSVMSETGQARITDFKQKHAATSIQRQWRQRRQQQETQKEKVDRFRQNQAAKKIQDESLDFKHRHHEEEVDDQEEKVDRFRQNQAAKKIQNKWLSNQRRRHEEEVDDAACTIQAALSGHRNRKSRMSKYQDDGDSTATEEDDDVFLIQSSMRGHHARLEQMKNIRNQRYDSYEDEDEYYDTKSSGVSRRSSVQRPSSAKGRRKSSVHTS